MLSPGSPERTWGRCRSEPDLTAAGLQPNAVVLLRFQVGLFLDWVFTGRRRPWTVFRSSTGFVQPFLVVSEVGSQRMGVCSFSVHHVGDGLPLNLLLLRPSNLSFITFVTIWHSNISLFTFFNF